MSEAINALWKGIGELSTFTNDQLRDELNRRNTVEYVSVEPAEVAVALGHYNGTFEQISDVKVAARQMRHCISRDAHKKKFSQSLTKSIGDVDMGGIDKLSAGDACIEIAERANRILERRSKAKHI